MPPAEKQLKIQKLRNEARRARRWAAAVGDQGIINRLLEAARELDQEADALEATELFAAPEAVPDVGQVQHVQMQAQQQQSNPIVARRDDDRDEES